MLNLFSSVRITGIGTKAFHPRVCDTVKEDDEGFDEFSRIRVTIRGLIPCPSELSKCPKETSEGQKSIAPENAAL